MLENSSINSALASFIKQEQLPPEYKETALTWFLPLAEELLQKLSNSSKTLVVGISGCQGSGKSTLASLLVILLKELMGIRSVTLSIDDFYLRHAERQALSKSVHPLLATRGVPGTHDVALAVEILEKLSNEGEVRIPRFDKAVDDRVDEKEWPVMFGPVDIILLEGWCISIDPQDAADLHKSVNELEEQEDATGQWREYVNYQLKEEYPSLYNLIDYLVVLKAPSFEKVFQWRQTQEDKLAEKYSQADGGNKIMNTDELKRFIQHYERLTRHGLQTLPEKADSVFLLSDEQTILGKV